MHHAVLIFLLLLMFHNCDTSSKFQSTLPRRERQSLSFNSQSFLSFQPTLPRRERRIINCASVKILLFQPTLPRRERHDMGKLYTQTFDISTHTPTKGATKCVICNSLLQKISTHTPTKGATNIGVAVS